MPAKTLINTEQTSSEFTVKSDGTVGGTSGQFRIVGDLGSYEAAVDLPAAVATAAAAIGGGRTAAEVRECLRQVFIAARAQARTAGGWT